MADLPSLLPPLKSHMVVSPYDSNRCRGDFREDDRGEGMIGMKRKKRRLTLGLAE